MNSLSIKKSIVVIFLLFLSTFAFAHPTGNMITIGESVLWSYINPINDPDHHACVMIWTEGAKPNVFFQSEHAASITTGG